MNNSVNYNWGFTALSLIFITLKLCKIITWSWIWVLSPIWIIALLVIILIMSFWCYKRFSKYLRKLRA